jgi:hypothetical protein
MLRNFDVACGENHLPLLSGREASMKAEWDRAVVVATLAMAIIVCLWGIKILVMA